ncbi:tetratricopeptide repeat protein [Pseudomonas sp. NW5]|uniref:O-linked N-acetylglucosamine transferase, SPINDLY family protein n=1 Tax=Pseudomonas sp. NW5 TaxID=2934934 RepID=UPI00201FBE03|nr:tetratricopeptide repeat protein [Pseudomonas sp. NW5]MCL7462345.1 tetratricopeptide repeat protein [Pseudomonas sp. NW5]
MSRKKYPSRPRLIQTTKIRPTSIEQARRLTEQRPQDHSAWKALGLAYLHAAQLNESIAALQQAHTLFNEDAEVLKWLGNAHYKCSAITDAERTLQQALKLAPDDEETHTLLALIYTKTGNNKNALQHIERALELKPAFLPSLAIKAGLLTNLYRYDEAIALRDELCTREPNSPEHWNNLGNLYRDMGLIDQAYAHYRKSMELNPQAELPFCNLITAMHYDPRCSREDILAALREWERRYAPSVIPDRPIPTDRSPKRRLRIGMISDGFRRHPVGNMITSALEQLASHNFQLFFYSTNKRVDILTQRLRNLGAFTQVDQDTDERLAQRIRDDRIDILFDLCGHNAGTRSRVMAMQPAPLQVKWVGGLINTTGLTAIDYLLSDPVESPEGDDAFYTEKLIRMPGDYICYEAPPHAPDVGPLPAQDNDYITLGCFNNPTKINTELMTQWALLMHELPHSRLFLKGAAYNSEALGERICQFMETQGISAERLIIEGYSPHLELLTAYNRVDIALDPWPYSGGLTTCEALLMGVPVVTLPGPTFAGRHSATHLVNAGMPELVAADWAEYRMRVRELALDLDSLATIRRHLRDILLQSPVCNAEQFARHFSNAMRAIWQRYCAGKAPEALRLDEQGQAWFADESAPLPLQHAPEEVDENEFRFQFDGKIIALEQGTLLSGSPNFRNLQKLGAIATITFDPASALQAPGLLQANGELHHYPHAALGDGTEGTLYVCLDPAMSATLEPLPAEQQLPNHVQPTQLLTRLPISTLRLDDIEGLDSIDWLLLDNMNDSLKVLENGEQALANTLLVQVRVNFVPTHKNQPELTQISHWLARHGFSFYRFSGLEHYSHLPKRDDLIARQATQLRSADALFIPDQNRLAQLPANQRMKLAFVLHTVYSAHDLVSALLHSLDEKLERNYLIAEKFLTAPQSTPADPAERVNVPTDIPANMPSSSSLELPKAPHMSEAERALFKKALSEAKSYFEFGSGGSTVWAVRAGLTVKGVESDASWVNALKQQLGDHCQVEAVDIGPTREWGYPTSSEHSHKFANYSHAIKAHDYPFDLILVDGRFRVACTATTIQHILDHHRSPEDARIFIHDFWDRPGYHVVLDFLDTLERVDTAGLFKLKPDIKRADVEKMLKQYVLKPA